MIVSNQPPVALLRRPAVESLTGLSRSEIYRRMRLGDFPLQIKLGRHTAAWRSDEIQAWIAKKIKNSRS